MEIEELLTYLLGRIRTLKPGESFTMHFPADKIEAMKAGAVPTLFEQEGLQYIWVNFHGNTIAFANIAGKPREDLNKEHGYVDERITDKVIVKAILEIKAGHAISFPRAEDDPLVEAIPHIRNLIPGRWVQYQQQRTLIASLGQEEIFQVIKGITDPTRDKAYNKYCFM